MSIVLSLSGGLDSAVLLATALKQEGEFADTIHPVCFEYASKHNLAERAAAIKLIQHYRNDPDIRQKLRPINPISLSGSFMYSSSALLENDQRLPKGHYDDPAMRATIVPGRNMIFAAILAHVAQSVGATQVWIGTHKGDWNIYPDCRPEWLSAVAQAIAIQTDKTVRLMAPFMEMTKRDIVQKGLVLSVPFHLTHTCYEGGSIACGQCGSCQERLEAFRLAKAHDPLKYETRELITRS